MEFLMSDWERDRAICREGNKRRSSQNGVVCHAKPKTISK